MFRFAFSLPQWVQWAAAIIGGLTAVAVLLFLWSRREPIIAWFRSRSRPVIIGMAIAASVAMAGFAGGNAYIWHYTQHDNGFCVSCHVMGNAYSRFTKSQHAQLECHDCHQQPITASAWQLVVWVAERPDKIPAHAKVPNDVCSKCHGSGQKETWQRIASTAGHRVHLESDSSALRGVQCVTCHGAEVHQFAPATMTCGQAGCHASVGITLGKMATQTSLHCAACHQFAADVPQLATRDSAAGTLVPKEQQCLGCHQMQQRLSNFDAAKDPHLGSCGNCHNPHTQRVARDAALTCASAGCHSDWRKEPFHTGVRHRDVANQCILCHEPHQARVDASDCTGCHQAVQGRKSGRRTMSPPLPFDTTKALQGAMLPPAPDDDPPRGKGDTPPPRDAPVAARLAAWQSTPRDTFPHARHTKLACVTCHASERDHGRLTFEQPRGCQICHHQQAAQSTCTTCHTAGALQAPREMVLRFAAANGPVRDRNVAFSHADHAGTQCVQCHTTPVSLAPAAGVTSCTTCHESHHGTEGRCVACHNTVERVVAHVPARETHAGCDGCHKASTVSLLVPTRALCVTCHEPWTEHYPDRQCTTCHFQASPTEYREHLRKQGGRP